MGNQCIVVWYFTRYIYVFQKLLYYLSKQTDHLRMLTAGIAHLRLRQIPFSGLQSSPRILLLEIFSLTFKHLTVNFVDFIGVQIIPSVRGTERLGRVVTFQGHGVEQSPGAAELNEATPLEAVDELATVGRVWEKTCVLAGALWSVGFLLNEKCYSGVK